ncbi:JAB domain-containing protein [Sphingomonas sp. KR1UV-12]|uniref:JAB domain-containing protein n=1 Tax=Sphingomonas aurea TaxID=3063994 RepID=A0ABT9EG71_9SPHN|nr:JAB domain-containing protein [Sphingomonas sp. KR1UV-12]MDP1025967.1 JAB domain-containing protein [Sphingomonas sp. KR1UV-12]
MLDYLRHAMAFDPVEQLRAFFVNTRRELIAEEQIARGGPSGVSVEPRQVLVRALALGATGVILVHNHPSGDPMPSPADRRFTRRLATAGECLGIQLHDHLIVARGGTHAIEVTALPAA